MGPRLLMDKSTVRGMSGEEFKFVDKYYSHVISPILMRELSSHLAKEKESLAKLKNMLTSLASKVDCASTFLVPNAELLARYCQMLWIVSMSLSSIDNFMLPFLGCSPLLHL